MKLSMETVAALAVVVLGVSLGMVFTPPATWEVIGSFSSETWAGIGLVAAGVTAGFFGRPLVRSAPTEVTPITPTEVLRDAQGRPLTRPKGPPTREGSVSAEVLAWLMLWGLAAMLALGRWIAMRGGLGLLLVLVALPGCGSALASHARGARIAFEVHASALELAAHAREEVEGACETVECAEQVDHDWAPVAVGFDAVRATLVAYASGVEIAHLAGSSDALIAALIATGARLLREWENLRGALATVGVEGPRMPEIVSLDAVSR